MAEIDKAQQVYPDASRAFVDMQSTNNTATIGDWLVWSGTGASASNTANLYYRYSGIGIALANNPNWDAQGSAYYQSAMPVGVAGTFHVSGVGSASAGFYAVPMLLGSGIVGQTGATGQVMIWTAQTGTVATGLSAVQYQLANASGGNASSTASAFSLLQNSGVAVVTRIYTVGAVGPTAEWEIRLIPPTVLPYLPGGGAGY